MLSSVKAKLSETPVVGPALKKIYQYVRPLTFGASSGALKADVPVTDWTTRTNDLPWFDRPDALDVLELRFAAGEVCQADYALLKKWIEDGYVVLEPGIVSDKDIQEMVADLDDLFVTKTPRNGLNLLGVSLTEDGKGLVMPHRELVALSKELKAKIPTNSNWRIHEFHAWSDAAKQIFTNREITRVCSLIFGKPAYPRSTINFMYGSQQKLHQDMAVFHVFPHNYLIGAWLACEDISPQSGPLVYYPGSHRVPMWEGFENYPQTQLRTCSNASMDGYHDHVENAAKAFPRKEFLAKKGEVLLWHGSLIHGGSGITQKGLTRKSFVIHYLVDGVDQTSLVRGPFNWE